MKDKTEMIHLISSEYLAEVARLREKIEQGGNENLQMAEKGLAALADIRPWRLEYICARVALLLAQGTDKAFCRGILDGVSPEFYVQDGLDDILDLKQRTYDSDSLDFKQMKFSKELYSKGKIEERYFQPQEALKRAFLTTNLNLATLENLIREYYITRNMVMYVILKLLWCKMKDCLDRYDSYICNADELSNIGYITRMLTDGEEHTFLLVDSLKGKELDLDVLGQVLQLFGQKVILLRGAYIPAQEECIQKMDAVRISIEKGSIEDGNVVIPITCLEKDNNQLEDVGAELIQFIADSLEETTPLIVFSTNEMMDVLQSKRQIAKHFQQMSACVPPILSYTMAFAWAGDYLKYISYIYGFSVQEKLNQKAEYDFSIVLPVRNTTDTLRYTLITCLNQRYQGSYEVVLSDNSDSGNHAVYDLYQEMADEHLHYYRTPQTLELAKSFEFAFLQAKGEFIFSLGADDGMFSWTLDVLQKVMPYIGKTDILQWTRGFYAWPGFNYGQQNQLVIPLYDKRQKINLRQCKMRDNLSGVIQEPRKFLYDLPLFYINSGFRKAYLNKILQETGRLWDGPCQDTYMGVANILINDTIWRTDYPLTMAGMSASSIGGSSLKINDELDIIGMQASGKKTVVSDKVGNYVGRQSEYLFPVIPETDLLAFYWPLFRFFELGCVTESDMQALDMKQLYIYLAGLINLDDTLFEKKWASLFYAQYLLNKPGIGIRLKDIYRKRCTPQRMKKREYLEGRWYAVGVNSDNHTICIDASKFGITNIKEAIDFIENIIGT